MPRKANELKVGLAVLLSLVILVGGIMWGKGFRLNAARYAVVVKFNNIGGLESGANVMANGVVKGRVKEIDFQQGHVLIVASLDKEVKIYSDYFITIEAPTVMAGNALSIYTGTQMPEVDLSSPLTGNDPMGVSSVVARVQDFAVKIEETLGYLNTLLVNLNRVVGDSTNQGNLSGFLAEASTAAKTTNELLTANRDQIQTSLNNLEAAMTSAKSIGEKTDARLPETMDKLDSAMTSVTLLANDLRGLTAKIQSDDGTVGKLLNSDELYVRINTTLADLDSLANDIRTKGLRNKIILF